MVEIPADDQTPLRTHLDLTERECAAIGLAVTQWAFLESAIYKRTVKLAKLAKIPIPSCAESLSFTKRLRALRCLGDSHYKSEKRCTELAALVCRIGTAEGRRHKIIHGIWTYDPRKPDQLWSSGYRPNLGGKERFDVAKLIAFALEVGRLSAMVLYPRGLRDVPFPYASMSRSFLRECLETDPPSQDHHPAKNRE